MASKKPITQLLLLIFLTTALFSSEKIEELNKKGHNELNNVITELADKLFIYNKLKNNEQEIALTTFVDLHQLNKTTHFGRTISEAFFDELFTRGFNVSDFRGQETISINANGEYFLTRDIRLLNKDVPSAYILVGTYSMFDGKIHVNARILDNQSGKVLASARSNYLTDNCQILENCQKPRKIKITTDGCSTIDCPKNNNKIKIDKSMTFSSSASSMSQTIPNTVVEFDYHTPKLIKKKEFTQTITNSKVDIKNNYAKSNNYPISLIK